MMSIQSQSQISNLDLSLHSINIQSYPGTLWFVHTENLTKFSTKVWDTKSESFKTGERLTTSLTQANLKHGWRGAREGTDIVKAMHGKTATIYRITEVGSGDEKLLGLKVIHWAALAQVFMRSNISQNTSSPEALASNMIHFHGQ